MIPYALNRIGYLNIYIEFSEYLLYNNIELKRKQA